MTRYTFKRTAAGLALAATGLVAGGTLAGSGIASAASTVTHAAASAVEQTKSIRSDEHLLTGDTAAKVKALAVATYPTATVERVETDSDGVYEAHLQLADGSQLVLQVGKDLSVTGTQAMGGMPGGAPTSSAPMSSAPTTTAPSTTAG